MIMVHSSARSCLPVTTPFRKLGEFAASLIPHTHRQTGKSEESEKAQHVSRSHAASLVPRTHCQAVKSEESEEARHLSLSQLPVEILLNIRDRLPLSSAASFTLTNRNFMCALGQQPFHLLNLQEHRDEKTRFLFDMQRDLLDWQLCFPCQLYHPVDLKTGPTLVLREGEPSKCVKESGKVMLSLEYQIRFKHAQLIMNRYRSGALKIKDLDMLSYDSGRLYQSYRLTHTITAAVVEEGLLVQRGSKVQLPQGWDTDFIEGALLDMRICPHVYSFLAGEKPSSDMIICCLSHKSDQPRADFKRWKSCNRCRTRFRFEIEELNTPELCVQLVVYKWLGSCETPLDPVWRNHCDTF